MAADRPSSAAPSPVTFAALLAAAIVFGWIDVSFAIQARADKDFFTFYDAARALVDGRDLYESGKNLNPPHLYLILRPLAWFDLTTAWIVWGVASVVALALSLRLIVRELRPVMTPWRWWVACVAFLAAPATSGLIITGQLSWLLMWPLTIVWSAARRSRWATAGIVLGLAVSIKPFLAILLPYLLLQRRWRAVALAVGSAVTCVALGALVLGPGPYRGWAASMSHIYWAFLPMNASVYGFLLRSLSPAVRPYYEPIVGAAGLVSPLWTVKAAAIALISLAATFRMQSVDRGFALMLVAALLVSPLGWIYYLWLLLGPALAMAMTAGAQRKSVRVLASFGAFALYIPVPTLSLFQPSGAATVSLGSLYLWGLLAVWIALLLARDPAQSLG